MIEHLLVRAHDAFGESNVSHVHTRSDHMVKLCVDLKKSVLNNRENMFGLSVRIPDTYACTTLVHSGRAGDSDERP